MTLIRLPLLHRCWSAVLPPAALLARVVGQFEMPHEKRPGRAHSRGPARQEETISAKGGLVGSGAIVVIGLASAVIAEFARRWLGVSVYIVRGGPKVAVGAPVPCVGVLPPSILHCAPPRLDIGTRQICKLCYQINVVGFHVPGDVWAAVVPECAQNGVVCLPCFARLADEKLVPWDRDIEFLPVSLATHLSPN